MLTTLIYSLLALDQTVATLAAQYGAWVYAILFVVIFAETGLVVCPFLPGDSILFIAGTVVAVADLNVHVLVVVLIVAAVLGDSVNYAVGHYIGPKAFHRPDSRWFRQEYLRRTQAFYDKYGGDHDHHRPLHSDHPDVRAVPRRRGRHVVPALPFVQRRSAVACGSARWFMPVTCSATSRG